MSTPNTDYFADHPERVAALESACASWQGTPFRKHSQAQGPGGGVDCGNFVGAVYFAIGAVPFEISVPPYELNHAEHSDDSELFAYLQRPEVRARLRRVADAEPPLDGDLVFPEVGRCIHHLGIRIGDDVHHVARPTGYCVMRVSQLTLHRSRYRLIEETGA